jgi:DNA polymerase I-like protein with 3'-5' exonuclease and polymerase domains
MKCGTHDENANATSFCSDELIFEVRADAAAAVATALRRSMQTTRVRARAATHNSTVALNAAAAACAIHHVRKQINDSGALTFERHVLSSPAATLTLAVPLRVRVRTGLSWASLE